MRKRLLAAVLVGGCFLLPEAALSAKGDKGTAIGLRWDGWVKENGTYHYYRSGRKIKGILRLNGKVYYLNPVSGDRMTGVVKIGNKYYYFDPKTGARKRGLVRFDGEYYYFSAKWYAVKGFHQVNKKLIYCNSRGQVTKPCGLVDYKGRRYYYDPKTGKKKFGWMDIGAYTYYFSRSHKYALTGWQTIHNEQYYFNARGILLCNRWVGNDYYVDDDGKRVKGWLTLGDETFYLSKSNGKMRKGFVVIQGTAYYFDEEGRMIRDAWVDDRYFNEDGAMEKNTWIGAFYVGTDGKRTGKKRTSGFFIDGGNTYYLNARLEPVTGWVYEDGAAYYFDEVTGVLQRNLWVGDYYLDENGKRVTGKLLKVGGNTYYFDEAGLAATGLLFLGEDGYFFDQSGVMQTGFLEFSGDTYYFDPSTGKMAVNVEFAKGGIRYLFDGNGKLIKKTKEAANAAKGQSIADYAALFEGNPYKSGGVSLTNGADSSGFTQSVLAHFGISVPRLALGQATGESIYGGTYHKPKKISLENLQPGDLVFYGNPVNHTAIYLGNGKIIHAFNQDQGIIKSRYDYRQITGCVRYW